MPEPSDPLQDDPPDLWSEIEHRVPGRVNIDYKPSAIRRGAVALFALALSAAIGVGLWTTFRPQGHIAPAAGKRVPGVHLAPPSPTPSPSSTAIASCQASNLQLSLVDEEEYSFIGYAIFAFTNTGSTPCSMQGYPQLVATRSGQPINIDFRDTPSSPAYKQASGSAVTILPGGMASFYLGVGPIDPNAPPCASPPVVPPGDTLEATPPGGSGAVAYQNYHFCPGDRVYVSPVQPGVSPPSPPSS